MKFRSPTLFSVFILIGAAASPAETLLEYQFSSDDPDQPSQVAEDVVGSPAQWVGIDKKSGFRGDFESAYVRTSALPQPPNANTFNHEQYLEITVTAKEGAKLDLSGLSFQFGGTNRSPNPRRITTQVRTSVDDFAEPVFIPVESIFVSLPAEARDPVMKPIAVDLSGKEFQNLPSITFRFYTAVSGTGVLIEARYDSIVIEGKAVR